MKVFLVDDHSVFRAGVKAEISDAVDIVGEAGTVSDAIAGINATDPDVVLLDVHMPDGGGVAVVRSILSQQGIGRNRRFLALSVSDAAEDVISVIRAGARGYVTKTISGAELVDAIRESMMAMQCFRHDSLDLFWMPSRAPIRLVLVWSMLQNLIALLRRVNRLRILLWMR